MCFQWYLAHHACCLIICVFNMLTCPYLCYLDFPVISFCLWLLHCGEQTAIHKSESSSQGIKSHNRYYVSVWPQLDTVISFKYIFSDSFLYGDIYCGHFVSLLKFMKFPFYFNHTFIALNSLYNFLP